MAGNARMQGERAPDWQSRPHDPSARWGRPGLALLCLGIEAQRRENAPRSVCVFYCSCMAWSAPQHFAAFIQNQPSAGLLIVPQHLPYAVVVEALLLIWVASEAEEWINRIAYLPL